MARRPPAAAGNSILTTLAVFGLLGVGIGGFLFYKVSTMGGATPPAPTAAVATSTADVESAGGVSRQASAWLPPDTTAQVVRHAAARGGIPVDLQFTGVDTLSREWLSAHAGLERLSGALSACVDGVATIVVAPGTDGVVRAVLDVAARQNQCAVRPRGKVVDVSPLLPAVQALTAWRDVIAATHEAMATLQVGVRVADGRGAVVLWADRDQFGPCLGLDGEDLCLQGGPRVRYTFDEPRDATRVGAVLGP